MKRRSFLQLLGLAPVAVTAAPTMAEQAKERLHEEAMEPGPVVEYRPPEVYPECWFTAVDVQSMRHRWPEATFTYVPSSDPRWKP